MSNMIEFHHVWKKFVKGEKFNSLRDAIPNMFRKMTNPNGEPTLAEREFWAVRDVSFDIPKGGVVGIMGPNGAGKSTTLKLLSGIISPNKGEIKIHGRLSALIEVTAGFHPELTGRENVYLNGTILGMKRREIDSKFDQIVEFSGIGEFIDTPVKRYSSGMFSRLGFSVAAHMDPEILLVDEVLSVGDTAFQAKCAEKMRDLLGSGATIVLVSHNLPLIQSLCKRAILIDHGEVLKDAATDEVIPYYENTVIRQREKEFERKRQQMEGVVLQVKEQEKCLLYIFNVIIQDASGHHHESLSTEDDITFLIDYHAYEKVEQPVFRVDILRGDGVLCCSCISSESDFALAETKGRRAVRLHLGKLRLAPELYLLKVSVWDKDLIHPYAVRYKDVLKIVAEDNRLSTTAVFVPEVKWEKVEGWKPQ